MKPLIVTYVNSRNKPATIVNFTERTCEMDPNQLRKMAFVLLQIADYSQYRQVNPVDTTKDEEIYYFMTF